MCRVASLQNAHPVAETWRRVWGRTEEKIFADQDLWMTFSGKISVFTPKISDDLFLVIDQVFQILRFCAVLNVVYDPFFTRKTTISEKFLHKTIFFTLFVLSRASDNTTFLNIGGPMHGPSPYLKFWRTVPPVPLGLRPWEESTRPHVHAWNQPIDLLHSRQMTLGFSLT